MQTLREYLRIKNENIVCSECGELLIAFSEHSFFCENCKSHYNEYCKKCRHTIVYIQKDVDEYDEWCKCGRRW